MKILLLTLLLTTQAFAETYLIEGMNVDFSQKDGLLLKGCEKKCEALKVINEHPAISLKGARKGLKFSGSVGSDVCHDVYKASSLLGRDVVSKNQKAFCFFSDGSMVEINSLSDYLTRKKIIR
jgi:hypothetical protein